MSAASEALRRAERDGISVSSVSDGSVFTFTTEMLRSLLAQSLDSGKVIVFVQHDRQVRA